jgi:hypothetical protein
MPSASAIYSKGQFLRGSDLQPLGRRFPALIHSANEERIGQNQDEKLVVDLVTRNGQPWGKRLVLNQGNNAAIVAMHGDDYSMWGGRAVELWSEMVRSPQGQMVPGIKVAGLAQLPGGSNLPVAASPPNGSPPSAAAVGGLPPVAGNAPLWPPPSQQHSSEVPPLVDDEIPF